MQCLYEIDVIPQIMNKSDLDQHSIWYKLGTKISKNIVKSMTYKRVIIEWE